MSIITLLEQLRGSPNHPSLLKEAGRLFAAETESVVATVLKHFPELRIRGNAHVFVRPLPESTCVARQVWHNADGTQLVQPLRICRPRSLEDVKAVLQLAEALDCPVRAVGSAHAWSDVALTDGIVIETSELANPIPLDASVLRAPDQAGSLFHTEAGITIRDLNKVLDDRGLALINMGGFDGQTLAGVISTSTHGSGLSLGSFPAFVEALVVVAADGQVLQIEKPNGISEPVKFAQKYGASRTLRQEDRLFNASVVGLGCLGVVVEVILRVVPKYWLFEVRTLARWSDLRPKLQDGAILAANRHVEVWINPHKINGEHTCLLTLRNIKAEPELPGPTRPLRNLFAGVLASLPGAEEVLAFLFNEFPTLAPTLIQQALEDCEDTDGYLDVSYRVLNVGSANALKAVCAETGVDVEHHLEVVDLLLANAQHFEDAGIYHSGPIVLRYVAQSPGFLSMQPRPTCMIETPMLRDAFGADETLWRYEKLLTKQFKARPHWGQRNFLTGSHDMIRQLYPQLDEWLTVFALFNQNGRFSSRFTDRVGFSSHAPTP